MPHVGLTCGVLELDVESDPPVRPAGETYPQGQVAFDVAVDPSFLGFWAPHSSPVLGRVGVLTLPLALILTFGSTVLRLYLFRVL